ncbi:hypothetical protein ES703_33714 [subsurface metagenome]
MGLAGPHSRGGTGVLSRSVSLTTERASPFNTPLIELERTGEVPAVSGVYRGRPGGEESSPGIAQTNSELLPMGRGFSIVGAVG